MHQLKTSLAVQRLCTDTQLLEVGQNIKFDAVQTSLSGLDVICFNAEGDVLGLSETIVTLGELVTQHGLIFHADSSEILVRERHMDAVLKGCCVCIQVQEVELKANGWVEVVEEITPATEDSVFILIHGELVVDVLILDGASVVVVSHPANAVRPHPLIRDGVLGCVRDFLIPLCTGGNSGQLLTICTGEAGLMPRSWGLCSGQSV